MHTVIGRNVNDVLREGLWHLNICGVREDSRNGQVIVAPTPVMTVITHPWERVVFSPERDANPYFHLMEALWMLAGRQDVEWVSQFAGNMKTYAEPDGILHGAYGYRWRHQFGHDQIRWAVEHLMDNPSSRQCVIGMYDPATDHQPKKDIPCNTHIYFDLRNARLNMTVMNRSNDVIWGLYGSNVVHFSMLQEYMAYQLHSEMGEQRHLSNNYHIYEQHWPLMNSAVLMNDKQYSLRYRSCSIHNQPLMPDGLAYWNDTLGRFMAGTLTKDSAMSGFFNYVALPMYESWFERKAGGTGLKALERVHPKNDWRVAATEWIQRRENRAP